MEKLKIMTWICALLSVGIFLYILAAHLLQLLTLHVTTFNQTVFEAKHLQSLLAAAIGIAVVGWIFAYLQKRIHFTHPLSHQREEHIVFILISLLLGLLYRNPLLAIALYFIVPQITNLFCMVLTDFSVRFIYPTITRLSLSRSSTAREETKPLTISRSTILRWLFVIGAIAIMSYIPMMQTYGALRIGGDTIVPLIPELSYEMIYQWIPTSNGQYSSTDFVFWISSFHLLQKLGLTIYQAAFLYQFLIFFFSGLGLFKIYGLFKKTSLFGLVSAAYFLFSSYHYDHMVFFTATPVVIWLTYILMKFIKLKTFTLFDVVQISFLVGFIGNLPNPKYHFLLFLIYVVGILAALGLKLISLHDLRTNTKYFLLIAIMTTYLSIPFLYFGKSFAADQSLIVQTLQQGAEQHALDYGAALLSEMIRLWHTPSMDGKTVTFMNNALWGVNYYIIPLLVLGLFPLLLRRFDKNLQKIYLIFYILALFFVFLAKSSNPPLGFIYDWMVLSGKIFAFMRTSAGMVVYAAIFYALIYGIVVEYFVEKYPHRRTHFIVLSILLIIIPGYHYLSGEYFRNYSPVNPLINKKEFGLKIPQAYFEAAYILDRYKLDSKVDIHQGFSGYHSNEWGYFGFGIYHWLFNKPTVAFDKTTPDGFARSQTNTLFIVDEKSILTDTKYHSPEENLPIYQSKTLDIYQKPLSAFLPHFYVPSFIQFSNSLLKPLTMPGNPDTLGIYKRDRLNAVFSSLPTHILDKPTLEYKKINPTKYRVRIHKAKDMVPLIFLDNYHKDWKLFVKPLEYNEIHINPNDFTNFKYSIDEQSGLGELNEYVQKAWVTTIGDLIKRIQKYYVHDQSGKTLDSFQDYKIDFISRNFKGTIQNDNLANGIIFESWLQKPLNTTHITANGYANSWILNIKDICLQYECIKNSDGTYDFELLVEFVPQRLSTLGYLISFGTMLLILAGISTKFVIKKL